MSSQRIDSIVWGRIQVGEKSFTDAKMTPDGIAQEWDWKASDTQHDPGISSKDVQALLDTGADMIVLSKGMMEDLWISFETLRLLSKSNVDFILTHTHNAVYLYNLYVEEGRKVAALIHSTC